MIGIPVGLVLGNFIEWRFHQFMHKQGRKKKSMWSFHWHEHHKNCRKRGNFDPDYDKQIGRGWDAQTKEAVALTAGAVLLTPLAPVAPFLYGTLVFGAINYYTKHKRAHQDPEWGRANLPWHYDHHMGPDQEKNWGVTRPWFDDWLGTRAPYVGTERERADIAKRETLKERRAKAA